MDKNYKSKTIVSNQRNRNGRSLAMVFGEEFTYFTPMEATNKATGKPSKHRTQNLDQNLYASDSQATFNTTMA